MDTNTITTYLLNKTTATIVTDNSVSYSYPKTKTGFANTYSVLGLIVSIETTKQRGYDCYETDIRVAYSRHIGTPDGFSEWYKDYKTSFGTPANSNLNIYNTYIERHSATRLKEAHSVGVLAGELHVLTIINKYVELLFNSVDKEVITRQINELQSQLATIS